MIFRYFSRVNFQGLFKKALLIQVLFKPVHTLIPDGTALILTDHDSQRRYLSSQIQCGLACTRPVRKNKIGNVIDAETYYSLHEHLC